MSGIRKKIVMLPYDFDTAAGIDNYGRLVFGYELEDIDTTEGGETVYSGQNSVLWKNVRAAFHNELTTMYRNLRNSGKLSYDKIEGMFEDHQSKWPEALVNEDSDYKYIQPFVNNGENRLEMCLGLKTEQRKWWLYNRFKYIDSKYNAGDAAADSISFRGFALPAADGNGDRGVDITPYADIYATVLYGVAPSSVRAARNTAVRVNCPLSGLDFTDIYIYSASQIKLLGDLSPFKADAVEFSKATHLQALKLGDSSNSYSNGNLKSLTLGNNTHLKILDARNCINLGTGDQKSVDISHCSNIEEIYFDGTKILGLDLPNGGFIKKLHLPGTVTSIIVLNQKFINEFVCPSYSNISTLWLENNSSAINTKSILSAIPAGTRLRIIGIDWTCTDTDEIDDIVDILDTMRGLDETGHTLDVGHAQISGTIHVNAATGAQVAAWNAKYPYITFDVTNITSYLTFKTWDGGTTVDTVTCYNGVMQGDAPSVPARSQTAQYNFTAVGWNRDMDASTNDASCLTNVIGDRTVYAAYSRAVRSYTITFVKAQDDGGGTLQTRTLNYGTMAAYTGSTPTTTKGSATDYPFEGWTPALATVTSAATYTAKFGSPVEVAEISDSWDTILANIDNGTYATEYKIGNYKPLDLGSTYGTVNMQIVAFDTDTASNGSGTAPVTFISKDLVELNTDIRKAGVNVYDWAQSDVRTLLNGAFISSIPSSVRSRLVTVNKTYGVAQSGVSSTITNTSQDTVWIPSAKEAANTVESSGIYYSKFFGNASRKVKGYNGSPMGWSFRSARYQNTDRFYTYMSTDGSLTTNNAMSDSTKHAIGFCLGKEQPTITDSWDDIFTAESNGTYNTKYSVGDTKELDLGTEGRTLMEIVAFDADDLSDNNGKAKITWISKTCLKTLRPINNSQTSNGGYASSVMRTYVRNTIKPLIPSAVRSEIKNVKKYSNTYINGGISKDTLSTEDVWIPSSREIMNTDETTGVSYNNYFNTYEKRTKAQNGSGTKRAWWLRTVKSDSAFGKISNAGTHLGSTVNTNDGVVIGFCT